MEVILKQHNNVNFITLMNEAGMVVTLCSLGASFYDIKVIDKEERLESVILTPSDLETFYTDTGYYGKCVGRYSGRIDDAKCSINGKEYILDRNWNGVNSLHGGFEGIGFANFHHEVESFDDYTLVTFKYLEKANKLPGDVSYKFTYKVMNKENDITLNFEATTTEDTVVNLTNHAYFNLSGEGKRTVMNQKLQFLCDRYTRLNNNLITITVDPVNEVFDFREMHEIGKFINDPSLQDHIAKGYDHCFLKADESNPLVAVLKDDISGRKLSVYTSYPAVVCYAGCYPGEFEFNETKFKIQKHHAVCLECQYVPNGINMEDVDKAILRKGETYNHYIRYHFDVE